MWKLFASTFSESLYGHLSSYSQMNRKHVERTPEGQKPTFTRQSQPEEFFEEDLLIYPWHG